MALADRPSGRVARVFAAAVRRYMDDGMSERAPALAYYGVLSLFPMLLIGFSILRFVGGDDAPADVARFTEDHGASSELADTLRSAATTAQSASSSAAGTAGLVGALTLLYGASKAFTAFGRAVDVAESRRSAKRTLSRRAKDLGWTLLLLVLGMATLVLALLSGHLLTELVGLVGIDAEEIVWTVLRWPTVAALLLLIVAVIRWAAPTGHVTRFRLITPGMLFSVAALVLATRGYNVYLSLFASYNQTYGAFAGAVILLLWIWLAAGAVLLGAELDAELRARDIAWSWPSFRERLRSAASDRRTRRARR